MPDRIFGDIPEYPPGSIFESRAVLSEAGVHKPLQAGISGNQADGADSIVLSGGYEDDEDHGDMIIYTGAGGRDLNTGVQIHDQPFDRGNRALAFSCMNGLPVRVIRGAKHDSPYSPPYGYVYDGLYIVERYWHEPGRSGFRVWRFKLVKIESDVHLQATDSDSVSESSAKYSVPERRETTTLRLVRNVLIANQVKAIHKYRCQMCGLKLDCPAGPYAEAAHIRPLGSPHNGPDTLGNLLCLCPNHRILFDSGATSIADDLKLIGESGSLSIHPKHVLDHECIAYHREHNLVQF